MATVGKVTVNFVNEDEERRRRLQSGGQAVIVVDGKMGAASTGAHGVTESGADVDVEGNALVRVRFFDASTYFFAVDNLEEVVKNHPRPKRTERPKRVKPPVGVVPKHIHRANRIRALDEAIQRYEEVGLNCGISLDWRVEKLELEMEAEWEYVRRKSGVTP